MAEDPLLCRICRKPMQPSGKHFPFCSERCRLVDLGNWLDEKYRTSRIPDPDDAEDENGGETRKPAAEAEGE